MFLLNSMFTYYLAKTLEDSNNNQQDNTTEGYLLGLQYADDISIITDNYDIIEKAKTELPSTLGRRGLKMNAAKTEEFKISRGGEEHWKTCKFLGSLLDTKEDLKRRKMLAFEAIKTMNKYFKNKKLSVSTKCKIFDTYISSIYLYNCELWTLTETLETSIDAFQRRLLRSTVLNIRWPRKMRNEDVYRITKQTKWSIEIARRRISWLGHLFRLPENTPAKIALNRALEPMKRNRGRPKLMWITMIRNELKKHYNITIEDAMNIAHDKDIWKMVFE